MFFVIFQAIHKLLGAAIVLSVKFWDDMPFTNRFYASVVGMELADLNTLELDLYKMLDYHLAIEMDEFTMVLKKAHLLQVNQLASSHQRSDNTV